jgi:hypothetical protein
MFDHHCPNCPTPTRGIVLLAHPSLCLGFSILRTVAFAAVALLASGLKSNVEARGPAQEIELPSMQGWQIEAIKRGNSVMCSARQNEENGQSMTLLADTGKYRGGVWFLEVASRDQHLEPGLQETVARLFLNGNHVVTGTALATVGAFVRFDFPAIDAHVKDIKAARVIEVQAEGLSPLKLESLSPIITAIEKCQQESLNPKFWKDAKDVCN